MKNYMFIIGTFLCNFLFVSVCYSQNQGSKTDSLALFEIPATIGSREFTENLYDKSIVRVLDGLQLNESESVPKEIEITAIRRLNDRVALQNLGIKKIDKQHIFYSSRVSTFHKDVYSLVNLPSELRDVNVPLVINNELITPEKYHSVEEMNISRITKMEFIKPSEALLNKFGNAVMGVIKISLAAK
jgi:hypothetical protein